MIELREVRLERGSTDLPLLHAASLRLGRGEVVLLTAAAGIGSSTVLAAILGEHPPAAGSVAVFGRDLARLRPSSLLALRRRLGVVPQGLELLGERSAVANVGLPLEIDQVARLEVELRARAALAKVGLEVVADQPAGTLSLAAQQSIAIARALVRAPRILLADQPTAHQDDEGTARTARLFADAADAGASCLVVTRDPALVAIGERLGWRRVEMAAGQLIEDTMVSLDDLDVSNVVVFPVRQHKVGTP